MDKYKQPTPADSPSSSSSSSSPRDTQPPRPAPMQVPKSRTHLLQKSDAVVAQRRRLARLDVQTIQSAPISVYETAFDVAESPPGARSLSVALIGIPNAGKSTLTNRLVGTDVSIVTPKAQTTRERMLGLTTIGNTQLVFYDTPGTVALRAQSKRRKRLQRSIIQAASNAALDADVVCLVVDAARAWNDDSDDQVRRLQHLHAQLIKERAQDAVDDSVDTTTATTTTSASSQAASANKSTIPFILVMNKCDLVSMERAKAKAKLIEQCKLFSKTFFLSAERNNYVDQLREHLISIAPEADWFYPPDMTSDMPPMQIVEECIREQFMSRLNQELPYHIKQRNLGWTDLEDGSLRIDQYLIVENLRVKRILVGHQAGTIKVISRRARARISERLERNVHLFLTVKVEQPK